MKIEIDKYKNTPFVRVISENIEISNVQNALDLIAEAFFSGIKIIITKKEHFSNDFFDLKSKLAGDILQKFSNYQIHLAIVGDFEDIQSNSLNNFIHESNKSKLVVFVSSEEEAMEKLIN
jgi:nicotinamidase-related amidase